MTNPTGSILVRRGPTTDRNGFYPLAGEIIYDTTTNRFHVGDGVTAGGVSINQRDFPNPGVMIKGLTTDSYLVAPGSPTGGDYQFLVYSKANAQYEFSTITASGVAITNLTLSGTNGILVTRTDTDPDQSNPTITTNGQITFDINPATIFANSTLTGTTKISALSASNSTGTNGQVLSSTGTGLQWITLSSSSISNGTSNVSVASNANVTIAVAGNTIGTFTSTGLGLSSPLALTQGGTGATSQSAALTNLVPTGETSGYVLTTSGRGGYYWAAPSGGGAATGTSVNTSRVEFTATASQTLFTGVGTYTAGAGQLRVYVDGVRQFPAAYTETSSTSFTLSSGVTAGAKVLAEVDGYVSVVTPASSVTNSPAGNISATNVQAAINELDSEKAPKADPTFTGTVAGITSTMVGLGNVTNESKATMFTSPTFTGITTLSSSIETFSSPSITSNQVTLDYSTNSTFKLASNSANVKALFTNVPTTAGLIIPSSIIITQGSSAYYINAISINGVDQSIKWIGGSTPSPVINQTAVINLAFICTATSTYTIIASFISYN